MGFCFFTEGFCFPDFPKLFESGMFETIARLFFGISGPGVTRKKGKA